MCLFGRINTINQLSLCKFTGKLRKLYLVENFGKGYSILFNETFPLTLEFALKGILTKIY